VANCTATGVTSSPSVGTPALVRVANCVATGVTSSPSVGAPALSRTVNCTANGVTASPSVGAPALVRVVAFGATGIKSTATVEPPAFLQRHSLVAWGIISVPWVGTPFPSWTAVGVTSAPTLGSPALTAEVSQLVATLKASLDADAWDVTGVCPLTDENGHGHIAYSLRSPSVSFTAVRELTESSDSLCLYVGSFAYRTPDPALISKIEALAGPALAAAEAELIAQL
jgi:hypothetical protein